MYLPSQNLLSAKPGKDTRTDYRLKTAADNSHLRQHITDICGGQFCKRRLMFQNAAGEYHFSLRSVKESAVYAAGKERQVLCGRCQNMCCNRIRLLRRLKYTGRKRGHPRFIKVCIQKGK